MIVRLIAAALIAAALAGLWWHGYKRGERADKQRSDLVIAGMVSDAQARLLEANTAIHRQSEALLATKERAARDLQTERARNERRLADLRATDGLMRDTIADFASGVGQADDTATCRREASQLGDVLAGALQAHGLCSANAEAEAANARSLLDAWPTLK